jgi:microcystin-dependent protein
VGLIGNMIIQPGSIAAFAGSAAPAGYLLCDGTTQSIANYPALYAAIGSTWNTGGELGTEFRLPNGHGRALIGAGTYTDPVSGSITRTLAGYVGAEKHVLSIPELATHTHIQNTHSHGVSSPSGGANLPGGFQNGFTSVYQQSESVIATNQNTGSGSAHNNMQPSFVGNWIIKF